MLSNDARDERALPPRWPRCARSAILHALSLARIAVIAATDRMHRSRPVGDSDEHLVHPRRAEGLCASPNTATRRDPRSVV